MDQFLAVIFCHNILLFTNKRYKKILKVVILLSCPEQTGMENTSFGSGNNVGCML